MFLGHIINPINLVKVNVVVSSSKLTGFLSEFLLLKRKLYIHIYIYNILRVKEPILLVPFESQSLQFSCEKHARVKLDTVIKQYTSLYGPTNNTLHAKCFLKYIYASHHFLSTCTFISPFPLPQVWENVHLAASLISQ